VSLIFFIAKFSDLRHVNGPRSLDALKESKICLILMDLQMPMDEMVNYDSNCNSIAVVLNIILFVIL
jgi:CheY-like chemotaxis protein